MKTFEPIPERIKMDILTELSKDDSLIRYAMLDDRYKYENYRFSACFYLDDYYGYFEIIRIEDTQDKFQIRFINEPIDDLKAIQAHELTKTLLNNTYIFERIKVSGRHVYFYLEGFDIDADDFNYFRCNETEQCFIAIDILANATNDEVSLKRNHTLIQDWEYIQSHPEPNVSFISLSNDKISKAIEELFNLRVKPEYSSSRIEKIIETLTNYLDGPRLSSFSSVIENILYRIAVKGKVQNT